MIPAPVLSSPKKQQCVVAASSAHLGRAQIAQLTVRLRIGILPACLHHVTLPQLSLARLQTKARESGAHLPLPKRPSNFTQTRIVYKLETRLPRASCQDLPTHHMCFHFVLFVALAEFVANPSNPPTRTNKAQARQHQPLLLGYLVTSQNTGVCCFPVAKLLSIGGLPLPLSQTRDWTTLSDPCLLLSFFMLLWPCPVLPACLTVSCLVLSVFALTSPMHRGASRPTEAIAATRAPGRASCPTRSALLPLH